jgi:curved DNA-binding protein CbpA
MTRDQARRVLGLNPNATQQDVKEAHRRLMSRVHPDKGGSAQQAAQINRAKDVLLGE